MTDLPLDYYDVASARTYLATGLLRGSLALFVGAGASKGVGLPSWWELVQGCAEQAGISEATVTADTPSEELRSITERIEAAYADPEDFARVVHTCLYREARYDETIITQSLLIAFGALMMSSKRGSISTVVTFNYDDVMEWYLGLHGFTTQVVYNQPALLGDVDVTMFHPHGYLPKERPVEEWGDFLILSQYSYDQRMADKLDLWKPMIEHVLLSKVGLFVGLSGDDPTIGPFLAGVKDRIEKSGMGVRPTAFWLLAKGEEDKAEGLLRRNVVPIVFDSHEEFPGFLLGICQEAAGQLA